MSQAEDVGKPNSSAGRTAVFVLGSAFLLITLWVASTAFAQEGRNTVPDVAALPASSAPEATPTAFEPATVRSLASIDPQADIAVILRSSLPAELQLAALRRAWTADPAIRDFKGLEENDWDFDNPNSIPGFGELGPEADIKTMVAQIFGETTRLADVPSSRPERTSPFSLANLARRLILGTVDN